METRYIKHFPLISDQKMLFEADDTDYRLEYHQRLLPERKGLLSPCELDLVILGIGIM